MQALTCPIPSNVNPLQSNGFMFNILKMPTVSFFCQEVNIPELSLPTAEMATPLTTAHFAGDKPSFGELTVTFLIDGDMANYVELHNWLIGLGFPESHEQYASFIRNGSDGLNPNPSLISSSDAVLQILGASNNPVRTVQFVNVLPTSLQSVQLQSTSPDTIYLAGVATFTYTYYKIT